MSLVIFSHSVNITGEEPNSNVQAIAVLPTFRSVQIPAPPETQDWLKIIAFTR